MAEASANCVCMCCVHVRLLLSRIRGSFANYPLWLANFVGYLPLAVGYFLHLLRPRGRSRTALFQNVWTESQRADRNWFGKNWGVFMKWRNLEIDMWAGSNRFSGHLRKFWTRFACIYWRRQWKVPTCPLLRNTERIKREKKGFLTSQKKNHLTLYELSILLLLHRTKHWNHHLNSNNFA